MAAPKPTLDELVTPITRAEFEASILQVMAKVGCQTSSWKPGAVTRALVVACSVVLAALSTLISLIARSGFLELASGSWLSLVAYYVYGVSRPLATYAVGRVRVDNSGGGVFHEEIGDLRVIGALGQEYVSTEVFDCAANQTGVYVTVRAVVSGRASGCASAGTITQFSGTYNGLTVTNPLALSASDDATDTELRALCKTATAAVSPNGPTDAYEYVAKTALRANGDLVGVNRARVVRGPGDGSCAVYVATASGAVPGTAGDDTTDLGRVQLAVNTKAVPTGMTADVASAAAVTVTVVFEVWVYISSGLTEAQAVGLIQSAVSEYIAARMIGGDRLNDDDTTGYVFTDRIITVITKAIPNDAAFHCAISTPAVNVACAANTVPVAGSITGVVHLVTG